MNITWSLLIWSCIWRVTLTKVIINILSYRYITVIVEYGNLGIGKMFQNWVWFNRVPSFQVIIWSWNSSHNWLWSFCCYLLSFCYFLMTQYFCNLFYIHWLLFLVSYVIYNQIILFDFLFEQLFLSCTIISTYCVSTIEHLIYNKKGWSY